MVTSGVAPVLRASDSSQAGPSLQGGSVQAATSSEDVSRNAGSSSQPAGDSPSHVVTRHDTHHDSDSDSDSSIQGSWNKFLAGLCFPRGR